MGAKIIFISGLLTVYAAIAWPSRDEVEKWAILACGIALAVLPVAKRWALEMIDWSKRVREVRRKDCQEDLKRERQTNRELRAIIRAVENDRDEWKRRYDGGSRDYPKMG